MFKLKSVSPQNTLLRAASLGVFSLFLAGSTVAQNQSQPKAVLFDSWSAPTAAANLKSAPSRNTAVDLTKNNATAPKTVKFHAVPANNFAAVSSVRLNAATSSRTNAAPTTITNNAAPGGDSKKSAALLAGLRPTSLEEQAFALVNAERRKQGLSALEMDLAMLYLAREHSANMARYNFFSHVGADGKTADARANEAGITDWRSIGENIAYNQNIKNSVEFAVQCWMNSPHHKDNLLDKKWRRAGIGIAVAADGKFYITQVFRN